MLNFDEKAIEKNIQYVFKDKALLRQALSHSSFITIVGTMPKISLR